MTFNIEGIGNDVEVIFCDVYRDRMEDGGFSIVNTDIVRIFSLLPYEEKLLLSNNVLRIHYRQVLIERSEVACVWFHSIDQTVRVMYEIDYDNVYGVVLIEDAGIDYTVPYYADLHCWDNVDVVVKSSQPLTLDLLHSLSKLLFFGFDDISKVDSRLREYAYNMFFDLLNEHPDKVLLHDVSHIEYDVDRAIATKEGRWIRVYGSNGRFIEILGGLHAGSLGGYYFIQKVMSDLNFDERRHR